MTVFWGDWNSQKQPSAEQGQLLLSSGCFCVSASLGHNIWVELETGSTMSPKMETVFLWDWSQAVLESTRALSFSAAQFLSCRDDRGVAQSESEEA